MQIKALLTASAVICTLTVPALAASQEQPQPAPQPQLQQQAQEQVRGSQLMTPEELAQHRERLRHAESEEEREKIRSEQHELMRIRAEQQGVKLPEGMPAQGRGGGMSPGPGGGRR